MKTMNVLHNISSIHLIAEYFQFQKYKIVKL